MEEPKDIRGFENMLVVYTYTDDKLFLKNDRRISQPFSMFPGAHFVCDFHMKNEECDVQVIFPLTANWEYNHYLILIYIWEKQMLTMSGYRSHTVYPPVWDRYFSCGPDYLDYVSIQKYINRILEKRGLKQFDVDEELEGKSYNFIRESAEEVVALVKEGKPYSILSVKAEAVAEKMKLTSVKEIS